jgi:hypothetical protein
MESSSIAITGRRAGMRMKAATPNEAIASRNERMNPEMIAGAASGNVIDHVMRPSPAPSVRAAFSYSLGA